MNCTFEKVAVIDSTFVSVLFDGSESVLKIPYNINNI